MQARVCSLIYLSAILLPAAFDYTAAFAVNPVWSFKTIGPASVRMMRKPNIGTSFSKPQIVLGLIGLSPLLRRLGFGHREGPSLGRRGGAAPGQKAGVARRSVASNVSEASNYESLHALAAEVVTEKELEASPADVIPVVIRYTGGVGYRTVFYGVAKCLKDRFKDTIAIRKTILASTSNSRKGLERIFEIQIADRVFNKRPEVPGVFLPMVDIQAAITKALAKREKEKEVSQLRAEAEGPD